MLATLDKFGRVLIPKKVREHLGINTETSINIVDEGTRIIIEPISKQEPLVEKNGLLIYTGKIQGDIESVVKNNRSQRMQNLLAGE